MARFRFITTVCSTFEDVIEADSAYDADVQYQRRRVDGGRPGTITSIERSYRCYPIQDPEAFDAPDASRARGV